MPITAGWWFNNKGYFLIDPTLPYAGTAGIPTPNTTGYGTFVTDNNPYYSYIF